MITGMRKVPPESLVRLLATSALLLVGAGHAGAFPWLSEVPATVEPAEEPSPANDEGKPESGPTPVSFLGAMPDVAKPEGTQSERTPGRVRTVEPEIPSTGNGDSVSDTAFLPTIGQPAFNTLRVGLLPGVAEREHRPPTVRYCQLPNPPPAG